MARARNLSQYCRMGTQWPIRRRSRKPVRIQQIGAHAEPARGGIACLGVAKSAATQRQATGTRGTQACRHLRGARRCASGAWGLRQTPPPVKAFEQRRGNQRRYISDQDDGGRLSCTAALAWSDPFLYKRDLRNAPSTKQSGVGTWPYRSEKHRRRGADCAAPLMRSRDRAMSRTRIRVSYAAPITSISRPACIG